MVRNGQIRLAEKVEELFEVGEVASLCVGRDVLFGLEISKEIKDVLAHGNTLAYQRGFCKRDASAELECGVKCGEVA
jgi:tRNA-dihydrouridine synthase